MESPFSVLSYTTTALSFLSENCHSSYTFITISLCCPNIMLSSEAKFSHESYEVNFFFLFPTYITARRWRGLPTCHYFWTIHLLYLSTKTKPKPNKISSLKYRPSSCSMLCSAFCCIYQHFITPLHWLKGLTRFRLYSNLCDESSFSCSFLDILLDSGF